MIKSEVLIGSHYYGGLERNQTEQPLDYNNLVSALRFQIAKYRQSAELDTNASTRLNFVRGHLVSEAQKSGYEIDRVNDALETQQDKYLTNLFFDVSHNMTLQYSSDKTGESYGKETAQAHDYRQLVLSRHQVLHHILKMPDFFPDNNEDKLYLMLGIVLTDASNILFNHPNEKILKMRSTLLSGILAEVQVLKALQENGFPDARIASPEMDTHMAIDITVPVGSWTNRTWIFIQVKNLGLRKKALRQNMVSQGDMRETGKIAINALNDLDDTHTVWVSSVDAGGGIFSMHADDVDDLITYINKIEVALAKKHGIQLTNRSAQP